MRNIAIVEDEDESAKLLLSYIDKYAAAFSQQYHAVRFHCADDFLSDYKAIYSVVFMDIQMPGMSGIDLAKYVWENKLPCRMILLTAYADSVWLLQITES